jgi:hypothetical protein
MQRYLYLISAQLNRQAYRYWIVLLYPWPIFIHIRLADFIRTTTWIYTQLKLAQYYYDYRYYIPYTIFGPRQYSYLLKFIPTATVAWTSCIEAQG